ncbi:MAG: polysaccharide biosynthesis C-terminal domain-containing protein [Saprospiraceae bacterium]|nr:polysaccharide biosynthesis C-terminal domain-containing protein [Saprospiraceae bacterium]
MNYSQLNKFVKLSLPILAYSLLNGFVMTFIFWIVGNYLAGNTTEFAIFRFGAREFPLIVALTTGLSNAFVPKIVENLAHNAEYTEGGIFLELKHKTTQLFHVLFPITIALMLVSKPLFPIVFNPNFTRSGNIFTIFLLLLLSRALFPQTILLALKQTKTLLWVSIIETLSIVLLSYLGIYWLNTEGVAWALVLGFLLEKIVLIIILKKRYSIDLKDYTHTSLYWVYSILLVLSYLIQLV